ncbi:MAG: redox-sensing transcriptional repressor Rex [Bacteroidales bacterium]|nr:redox-sensing transcriptional repressor Rex [Bacteroidales bacterium]
MEIREKRKYVKNPNRSLVILKSTLSRLPIYYCYLQAAHKAGMEYISSAVLATKLALNPVQVRKDLASVSTQPGRPKCGFRTEQLLIDMKNYLGYDDIVEAVIVGVGNFGSTLLQYKGFNDHGVNIAAGFDINPELQGKRLNGKSILAMERFTPYVKREHIRIGIIAVPPAEAQKVADLMAKSGIKAIWNFAPTHVFVRKGVMIKNENLAASLAMLSKQFTKPA